MIVLLLFTIMAVLAPAQTIDLKLDFQMNSVMQLDVATDGTMWGITSSNADLMPTIAGVYAVYSTNSGVSWDTSCITPNWWRWGTDIAAQGALQAWAITTHVDTTELWRTTNGGKRWELVNPGTLGLDRVMSIHFFTSAIGVAVGFSGRRIDRKWVVSRTTDGGTTWAQSIPFLAEPPTETLADVNDRSTAWKGGELCVGLSSGRILSTTNRGETWTMISSPLETVNGIVIEHVASEHSIFAVQSGHKDGIKAMRTTNGTAWTSVTLAPAVEKVAGLRSLPDGRVVTVPRSLMGIGCIDVRTGASQSIPPGSDGLAIVGSVLFAGRELLPGGGLQRVEVK